MPAYQTPEPISVTLDLAIGHVRIAASDRDDTVVEVRPSDGTDAYDVKAAQQTRVDYAGGTLRVAGPRPLRMLGPSRKSGCIEVSIELPAGSRVAADVQLGNFRSAGRLGECKVKLSMGDGWLEQTGPLSLHTSFGHVTADTVAGSADISTGSGKIQIGEIDGTAVVKNSNGDTAIDTVTGDARVRAANGAIRIDRAGAGIDAKTSLGPIRLGEVARGSAVLATSAGQLEIGIAEGTAAWLEVSTGHGHVHNLLEAADGPGSASETVEIHARTSWGDITIRRS